MKSMIATCSICVPNGNAATRETFPAVVVKMHEDGSADLHIFLDQETAEALGPADESAMSGLIRYFAGVPLDSAMGEGPFYTSPFYATTDAGAVATAATATATVATLPLNPNSIEEAVVAQEDPPLPPVAIQAAPPPPPAMSAPHPTTAMVTTSVPVATPATTTAVTPAPEETHGYTKTVMGFLPPGAMPGPMPQHVLTAAAEAAVAAQAATPATQAGATRSFGRSGNSRVQAASVGGRQFRSAELEMRRASVGGPVDANSILRHVGQPIAGKPGQRPPRIFYGQQGPDGKIVGQDMTPEEWERAQGEPQSQTEAIDDILEASAGQPSDLIGGVLGQSPQTAGPSTQGPMVIPPPDDDGNPPVLTSQVSVTQPRTISRPRSPEIDGSGGSSL